MNIKEFLKDYSSGKSIDMFSKEFINIANKMPETEKLLWQYNNTFQAYKNNRDILNKIFEANIDESVIIMQNFHVDIGNIEFGKNIFINKYFVVNETSLVEGCVLCKARNKYPSHKPRQTTGLFCLEEYI